MSDERGNRSLLLPGVGVAVAIGIAAVLLFGRGEPSAGTSGAEHEASAAAAQPADDPTQTGAEGEPDGAELQRAPADVDIDDELDEEGGPAPDGSALPDLTDATLTALRNRMVESQRESRAQLAELVAEKGLGADYAFARHMHERCEIALEKVLAGEFEVGLDPGYNPVRGEGEPDFMMFQTAQRFGDQRLWAKVILDDQDAARLKSVADRAGAATLAEWQAWVDAFNAKDFDERRRLATASRAADAAIRRHARSNEEGAAGERLGREELDRLREQRLPWFVRVDDSTWLASAGGLPPGYPSLPMRGVDGPMRMPLIGLGRHALPHHSRLLTPSSSPCSPHGALSTPQVPGSTTTR